MADGDSSKRSRADANRHEVAEEETKIRDDDDRDDDEQDTIVGQFFLQNPHLEAVRDANPEIARLFSDPESFNEHLRQVMNPRLRNEVIRSNDRAISNLNATPGGFNFLRQQYDAVQAPIYQATDAMAFSARRARRSAGVVRMTLNSLNGPNIAPLPNPWALAPSDAPAPEPPPPATRSRAQTESAPAWAAMPAEPDSDDDGFLTSRSRATTSSDDETFFSDPETQLEVASSDDHLERQ